jgi:putative endonuclease
MSAESTFTIGRTGENLAKEYLLKKGHIILDKNYYVKGGEIDLISIFDSDLYFYEVKYRSSNDYGSGEESITSKKISHIRKAIMIWLLRNSRIIYTNIYVNALILNDEIITELIIL